MKKQIAWLLAAMTAVTSSGFGPITVSAQTPVETAADGNTAEITYNYDGADHTRQMERLGRGLVAVKTNGGIFLSWRLLGTESSVRDILNAPDFKVYKNGELIKTVDNSTNYLDISGTESDRYSVAPVSKDGSEGEECGAVTAMRSNYLDIALDKPAAFELDSETSYQYTVGDCSTGDLDGDGEYEIVVKWDCNPQDNSRVGITGNVILDAYKMSGERMWRIDLGRNIRSGAHYTQFLVYDFDLDGKAEITCKTAPGSKDGKGEYVSKASEDSEILNADNTVSYVNDGGYILEGPEYFTIFDGETGAAIDTINYPVQRVNASVWGDAYGNRCDRFVADVSYMDGERPYAVYWRGYYFGQTGSRTGVFAASFDGQRLFVPDNHIFDTRKDQPGYRSGNARYVGQGNHNLTTADVDDDGKDEVISGALCLEFDENDTLSPKWCTFKEHGDALHIGDYDPTHTGLEFFTVHEDGNGVNSYGGVTLDYGASVIDAATGEIMKHWSGSKDTGRGLMANVGAGGYYQITATSGIDGWNCLGGGNFEKGTAIGYNFRVFWDGDLYDETLDGTSIQSWNGRGMANIFTANGCVQVNGTKANPALQADLFGDWREEVAYPTSDNSTLRVYTTTDLTEYKLPTLMHDPVYRSGVAAEQSAYNQPPHNGFYLADEIYRPAVDYLEITKQPDKTDYLVGEALELAGLEVTAHFTDGSADVISGYVITGYDPETVSEQDITVTYGRKTTTFKVRVSSGFTIDDDGYITGYELSNETAKLPSTINGVTVKGFRDGALKNSTLRSIVIEATETEFGEDVFPDGITIICYIGSDAYVYADENGINCQIIDTREYLLDADYGESEYSGYSMLQGEESQTRQIGCVLYGVGGRKGNGDGVTGFAAADIDGEKVMRVGAGNYASSNRCAYMTLQGIPMLSDTTDNVFETDIMFESGDKTKLYVFDSTSAAIGTRGNTTNKPTVTPVDTIGLSDGCEAGVWYTYKIFYHKGAYYRSLVKRGEDARYTKLSASPSETGVVKFLYAPTASYAQGICYLDNTKIYTNVEVGSLTLNITDKDGNPITNAVVTINDEEYNVNRRGAVAADLYSGLYKAVITAEGYVTKQVSIGVFKNAVEKTVELENEYIDLTGVEFEKDTLALKAGQTGKVTAITVPANATEQGVTYSSSDMSVAEVDNDGNVTAVEPGEAKITAKSAYNAEFTAECTVKVYADDYVSEITSIEILTPDNAYISNNAVPNEVELKARAYDQKGVWTDAEFTWTADVQNASIKDNKLLLPQTVKTGEYNITAKAGTVSAKKSITLTPLNANADMIAEEKLESPLNIHMGAADAIETIDDITYHTGARSGGGDGTTGFYIGNMSGRTVLRATAGRFSSADREAYFTFDKVTAGSAYKQGEDYVFETDIYFDSPTKMTFSAYSDVRGKALIQLDAETLGLQTKRWYHYMLIYSNEKYEHYAIDTDGNFVNIPEPVVSGDEMIAQIRFIPGDGEGSVYLAGTKYYSIRSAYSDVTLKAVDMNGAPISDAAAEIAGISKTTDTSGKAVVTLPIGIYNMYVNSGNLSGGRRAVANGENVTYTIILGKSAIDGTDGENITVTAMDEGLKLYAAKYNDGMLTDIKLFDVKSGTRGYNAGFVPDKVFLWDGDMSPVDSYIK